MSWVNYDDVVDQLRAAGLKIDHLEVDTPRPKCVTVEGRGSEKRGWYWLSEFPIEGQLYLVGSFGVYEGDDNGKRKVQLKAAAKRLTASERRALAERHKANAKRAKAIRQAEADKAAAEATRVWRAYARRGQSDYLARKQVLGYGVRFDPEGHGTMAIPMMDAAGRIHGLEIIRGKNRGKKLEKQYWPKGVDKVGHYHLIGGIGPIILVSEGYATAATLHEATGLPVAVAFDAGNLLPVVMALAKAHKGVQLLVCGDDDYIQKCRACGEWTNVAEELCTHCDEEHGKENTGVKAATAAALAVAGAWCVPQFPFDRDGKKLTDFNDLATHREGDLAQVRVQIEQAIERAGWALPHQAAPPNSEGEGEDAKGRRKAVSVMSKDAAIARFVPIDDGTGKHLFDYWTQRRVHRDQMLALLPAKVSWDEIKGDPVWQQRGAFYEDQIGFDPSGKDEVIELNTWSGWELTPKEGDCEMILQTIQFLCSGEDDPLSLTAWLLRWMAYPLQNPGAKMASAVIMHGPQGTSKSAIFGHVLAKIYGSYATVLNQRGLEDKFNDDWVDRKLLLVAEEVVTRSEMWQIKNELKELVTGEWLRVNGKHTPAYRQRNYINVIFNSNESQPLPLDNDDRPHLVIWTPPAQSEAFYDKLWLEIENGGIEAFYHFLLNIDLGDFHPKKRPPMTKAKQELINFSKPSELRFIDDWLDGELGVPIGPCLSADLYALYLRYCRTNGVKHPRESNQFLGTVGKLTGWTHKPQRYYETAHYTGQPIQRRVIIPPQEVLEAAGRAQPTAKTKTQWLTDRILEFKNAMERDQ